MSTCKPWINGQVRKPHVTIRDNLQTTCSNHGAGDLQQIQKLSIFSANGKTIQSRIPCSVLNQNPDHSCLKPMWLLLQGEMKGSTSWDWMNDESTTRIEESHGTSSNQEIFQYYDCSSSIQYDYCWVCTKPLGNHMVRAFHANPKPVFLETL